MKFSGIIPTIKDMKMKLLYFGLRCNLVKLHPKFHSVIIEEVKLLNCAYGKQINLDIDNSYEIYGCRIQFLPEMDCNKIVFAQETVSSILGTVTEDKYTVNYDEYGCRINPIIPTIADGYRNKSPAAFILYVANYLNLMIKDIKISIKDVGVVTIDNNTMEVEYEIFTGENQKQTRSL